MRRLGRESGTHIIIFGFIYYLVLRVLFPEENGRLFGPFRLLELLYRDVYQVDLFVPYFWVTMSGHVRV